MNVPAQPECSFLAVPQRHFVSFSMSTLFCIHFQSVNVAPTTGNEGATSTGASANG